MASPFVQSNYERIKNDDYQTVDPRCLHGLLASWPIVGIMGDPCHANGRSELVIQARILLRDAFAVDQRTYQYGTLYPHWVVSNPPYSPPATLNKILEHGIKLVNSNKIVGCAFLLRSMIDHGKLRAPLFDTPLFAGCVKLRFRPWWSGERNASPIHNFSWFIWTKERPSLEPIIRYWSEPMVD